MTSIEKKREDNNDMVKFNNEFKSRELLKEYGLPMGEYDLATTKEEAIEIAENYGYPLVMKIVSDQIIHKTEAGGIKLNIGSKEEVEETFELLVYNAKKYDPDAVIDGVLVSPMAASGVEVIVGGLRDSQFGPVVMFGLGGVFVEIFKDVQFRLAPLSKDEALSLIRSIKGFPLLDGARGQQPVDINALAEVIVNIGNYLNENEDVREIDLNPLVCYPDGIQALDASVGVEADSAKIAEPVV